MRVMRLRFGSFEKRSLSSEVVEEASEEEKRVKRGEEEGYKIDGRCWKGERRRRKKKVGREGKCELEGV